MKIIETHTAPNPRRVRIFLAEKGIEVPYEDVDLKSGPLRTPEFTARNPMQRVPVLELDDGTWISESMAICRYFEELRPDPPLFGRGAVGRALVEMWNRRVELGLWSAIMHSFRHLHPAMAGLEVPQIAEWGQANKPKALENLRTINDQLATNEFLAGSDFSVADITALVAVDFMKPARISVPEEHRNLARWHAQVSARPSARA